MRQKEKAILREMLIAIKPYIRKQEKSKQSNLKLKGTRKRRRNPKLVQGKTRDQRSK